MIFTKESAAERAKEDLANRVGVSKDDIETKSIDEQDFSDMSLGAPAEDEMAAQMIASGWRINLGANGKDYEYRADKYQLRLVGFEGKNQVVVWQN